MKQGQDSQNAVLHNDEKDLSRSYSDFLAGLGDTVSLLTHTGFAGGLDPRTTGEESVYWSSSTTELMFHVVSMMPTKENDPQQIQKKRQVGNDHVHIVWNEHILVCSLLLLLHLYLNFSSPS